MFPWLFLAAVVVTMALDQVTSRTSERLPSFDPPTDRAVVDDEESPVAIDLVCGMTVRRRTAYELVGADRSYYFCTSFCRDEFKRKPDQWLGAMPRAGHVMHGIPTSVYQAGVAVLLLLSFFSLELFPARGAGGAEKLPRRVLQSRWDITGEFLRGVLKAPLTAFVARLVFVLAFLLIIVAGLFGNQDPSANIAPILTWTIWWAGLIFLVLFFGKTWCYVCPWDAIATWTERLRFWGPRTSGVGLGLKWPRRLRNIWPAVALFLLLTWIELGMSVTVIPRATAWVALTILALAIVSAVVFERKSFCRYACLVGRISGLYSMFSSLELRATDPDTCASCTTLDCYHGNERGDGCPTFELPKTMQQSTYCILCAECMKTCPHDNISVRLRPWASDLVAQAKPRADEAILALILLSMTSFHGLTMTPVWPRWTYHVHEWLGGPPLLTFTGMMVVIIAAPILLFAAAARIAAIWSAPHTGRTLFLHYAYVLLPLALFYHLAHNAEHFLIEGPKVIALLSDPFGWGWDLFGTRQWSAAPLITLEGLWVLQVTAVLVGHVFSLWISARTTHRLIPQRGRAFLMQLPVLLAMILFSAISLWLLKQPMEMRLSAM
ncbi:MAG: YHS domain-containing protein [Planctomycetes bacterium]|nr:YHS domain-containing protein [Planctomycetota bacterium]